MRDQDFRRLYRIFSSALLSLGLLAPIIWSTETSIVFMLGSIAAGILSIRPELK